MKDRWEKSGEEFTEKREQKNLQKSRNEESGRRICGKAGMKSPAEESAKRRKQWFA